ncbi:1,4-dihydroxy-2-naphthoate octaprenyltransferase [Sedimentisphaera cyanobacteriorum]|uniref:1,4-dihydroxy-2-naphthoate octaprenyltransferase n=1 Tax=Sedimentisphaera cyanobacteriorum TaxID=1940790 RepID=A0A1Q2HLW2_9BACT|nr:1,4-dihydroxy-2-naphthoate octaprenyltransferase [Sedimentisphaera cyanobacteriorum]AQQ08244.1 1,4-dihydroxy-2-naphthoate octaprenyltransferase [Sedimentisphaera cyanobacteriorum]
MNKRVLKILCAPEPAFLLPGIPPVVIGTSLGAKAAGELDLLTACLAVLSIMCINAGSNMLNDYFDHLSGNDWLNTNRTVFGGGSRYIQDGILSPEQMRSAGLTALISGALIGLVIVLISASPVILLMGIVGVLAGVLWTLPPFSICYRMPGEAYIFTVFGILPTAGAYYLQAGKFSPEITAPAVITGLLIAATALLNSIPDIEADRAAGKKTFPAVFGVKKAAAFYRCLIGLSYIIAIVSVSLECSFAGGAMFYLFVSPLGAACLISASEERLSKKGVNLPNALNIAHYVCMAAASAAGIAAG